MKKIAYLILGFLLCGRALSMDPDRTFDSLNLKVWTIAEGAPPLMPAMAQTTDGTLWLGGNGGLSRFDGIRFAEFKAQWQAPFHHSDAISALAASADGGLWIGFRWDGLSFLKNGRVDSYGENEGIGRGSVSRILIDDQGTVWAAGVFGLSRKQGSRFERVVFDASDPDAAAWSILQDRAGTLWVLGQNSVVARTAGANSFSQTVQRTHKAYASPQALAEAPDGSVWAAGVDTRGLLRLNLPTNPRPTGNRLIPIPEVNNLIFDRDGNLWFSNKTRTGRITSTSLIENLSDKQIADRADYFSNRGLGFPGAAPPFLEDREGNMWMAALRGILRLSPSNVVRVPVGSVGESTSDALVIAVGDAGSLIAASSQSDTSSRVFEIRGKEVVKETLGPPITNSFRDADGTVWLNGPAGVSKYKNGSFDTTPAPAEVGYSRINAVTRDLKGALWVAFSHVGGLYRLSDGRWQEAQTLVPKLHSKSAAVNAASDSLGQLWFSYGISLVIVNGIDLRVLDRRSGFNLGIIGAIVARQTHVWVGGELGLVRFDGARMSVIRSSPDSPLTGISGLVETAAGDLWLYTSIGIVNISHAEVERATADSTYRVRYQAFTFADGVPGLAVPATESPTIVEATDGRIWFSSNLGLAYIDPTHIRHNTLPPPVTVWSIDSGTFRYPATSPAIRLPVHSTNVRISYTAGSLTAPEGVQFRYQLEGLDRDWQDAGDRREVAFANLRPGQYKFHVIAANNDGVWNTDGASVSFAIMPAFYQTKWFYGLCALLFATMLWVIYLMRIRQVRAQVRGRLEERLAERERIARDLHDTLLQSVQGLILRLRAAVKHEHSGALVEQGLERADEVLAEARDRVKHLRSTPNGAEDLAQDLATYGQELAVGQSAQFRSTVLGTPRDLHPIVGEEALFIAREALTNAFRHANARQIEADLSYDDAELRLRIRDDGKGIDDELLQHGGRDGHWGVLGMRERAKKIRATLTIWSKPDAGTEVDLRVPANVAFRSERKGSLRWWPRQSLRD